MAKTTCAATARNTSFARAKWKEKKHVQPTAQLTARAGQIAAQLAAQVAAPLASVQEVKLATEAAPRKEDLCHLNSNASVTTSHL